MLHAIFWGLVGYAIYFGAFVVALLLLTELGEIAADTVPAWWRK